MMATAPALDLRPANDAAAAPHLGIEASMALLGVVLNDNSRHRETAHIRPDHFSEGLHGRIWAAIEELISSGRQADFASVADKMAADSGLAELGGRDFIFTLWDKSPPGNMARQFAEGVMEAYTRRTAAGLLVDGAKVLLDPAGAPASSLIGALRQDLERLEQDASAGDSDLTSADQAAGDLLDALDDEAVNGRERGAMTGLRCFDRRMRGLRPGWLVVIGGRPSMAKSGLMRAAAYGAARRNPDKTMLIFSLEMDARECAERALSAASFEAGDGIAYSDFGGGLTVHERQRLRELRARMPSNVLIDDRSSVSLDDIRRRVWAVKARQPVGAIFLDYLQLLARPVTVGRNEALVLGDITRALKTLAREAETCVVLLSQLNRQVESRDDKRPQLADLRDSGSIEQDANAVLFPYREAYYLERAEPKDPDGTEYQRWQQSMEMVRRRMDVIAAKVRGGAIGTDRQVYFAEYDHVDDVGDGYR
ncbi:MAG: replicative DNA helicase [Caulobacteraceae bacterium]